MDISTAECFRDLRSSSKRVACQGEYQEARGQWSLAGSRERVRGWRPAPVRAHVPENTTARLCSRAPKGARASDSTDVRFGSCVHDSTDAVCSRAQFSDGGRAAAGVSGSPTPAASSPAAASAIAGDRLTGVPAVAVAAATVRAPVLVHGPGLLTGTELLCLGGGDHDAPGG